MALSKQQLDKYKKQKAQLEKELAFLNRVKYHGSVNDNFTDRRVAVIKQQLNKINTYIK